MIKISQKSRRLKNNLLPGTVPYYFELHVHPDLSSQHSTEICLLHVYFLWYTRYQMNMCLKEGHSNRINECSKKLHATIFSILPYGKKTSGELTTFATAVAY